MIDKKLADQLLELAQAFEEIGITPLICGGLGLYLCFHIVTDNFSSVDKDGWLRVLETTAFYPDLNIQQKRNMLDKAKRRLLRWFSV